MNSNPTGIGIFGGQTQNSLGGALGGNNNQFGNQNKQGGGLFGGLGSNNTGGLGLGGQTQGVLGMGTQQNNQQQGVRP
jgi:nuclear pore complex protein Nup54